MNQEIAERWKNEFENADASTIREWLAEDPGLVSIRVVHTTPDGRQYGPGGPLFIACVKEKSLEKVKALVEAGANINNSDLGSHWPADDPDIDRFLISQGVDVNQPSYLGFSAVGVSGLDTFFVMMDNGLDPDFAWPYNGETLLHVQSRHDDNNHWARAYCLIKAGANVNAQALSGLDDEPIMENEHFITYGKETPLHFAARLGSPGHARLLLDHGADPEMKTVSRRVEPKNLSPWEGEVTKFTWPLTNYQRVAFEPYEGETPLDMAIRSGHEEVVGILESI